MLKVFSIVGARPQFIKVAALHRAIINEKKIQHLILHTGQHYDYHLSEIFFNELEIPKPDFHLTIEDLSTAASTKRMTDGIEKILKTNKPDIVVVFGDTNSTLAGALAAKKLNIKVAHVEAGLRSYNTAMPEEHNRIETDKISDLLFCPTTQAVNNLLAEGFSKQKIILSGDIMLDSINYYKGKVTNDDKIIKAFGSHFILCTFHRQSLATSASALKNVIKAINEINIKIPVIMPAHPRLKNIIEQAGIETHFKVIDPVGYLEMISLLKNCKLVITDSGGLQKEAFFSKKICITVREETEWTELVEAGVNFITGTSYKKIMETFDKAFDACGDFSKKFYGDGNSASIITKSLLSYLDAIEARATL